MKRVLILLGALALPATVAVSNLDDCENPGGHRLLLKSQDRSVVVRRVYEGALPEFWASGPSPDGRYVTRTDWSTGDLAVFDLLTGQMRRVTDKGAEGWDTSFAYSEMARFSPDGQRIAYSWFAEPGTYELRVINVDGTDSRGVAVAGFEPVDPPPSYLMVFEWWPDLHGWSPDGRHILATLHYGDRRELTLFSVADGSQEVLLEHQPVGSDAYAALSPDGDFLAYGAKDDVFVKPLAGGDAVAVASGPSKDALVGWTDPGNLLYISDRELTEGVWRVPIRDGRPAGDAALVAGDLWGIQPMGIAGNSLIFGIQTQAPRLHALALDLTRNQVSGTPIPIEQQTRESSYPAWSPDGERLLYWVFPAGRRSGLRLMLRSTAGGEARDVTPASLKPSWDLIRWSKDGRRVLIRGEEPESGREGFFAYTLATGEIQYVFSSATYETGGAGVFEEMFSSDWGTVYLPIADGPEGPFSLLRVDIAGGAERELLSRPARTGADAPRPFRRFFPSPDDRFLAFWEVSESDTARMLRVMSSDGGDPRTLLSEAWGDGASAPDCVGRHIPLWTGDEHHLLTILQDSVPMSRPFPPNPCKIYKVPLEGGDPIYVGAMPQTSAPSPWALSPDNSRLVFRTGEGRGELWILEGLERR